MSEEIECKTESDKFEILECLIKEYYELVKKNKDGLPPYATFKAYLSRPEQIKELVKNLDNDDDEVKLSALSQLWVQGDIKIDEKTYNGSTPRLIHSATQKGKLQSAVKEITKDNLSKIAELIYTYVINIDKIEVNNEIFFNEENMQYFNNKFNAVLNELLFWFYYEKDKFPLINSRAKNSKKILELSFGKKLKSDLEFNNICFNTIGDLPQSNNGTKITKQLMLDQLFYTIDDMKSMKEVNEKYSDKNNEVYKFYKKLWNTIKEVKRTIGYTELNKFKNIIYHGAPGTGKTYELKQEIAEHLDLYEKGESEFIQFHGSYYYEDFIGGLKPTPGDNVSLKFQNGIFKKLCREAAKYEVAYYKNAMKEENKFQIPLKDDTKLDEDLEIQLDDDEKSTILIKKKVPVLSQFPPYFILIDEINRADLSKVFGELLFAIEDDYRGFEHRFKLSSSNMETEETAVCWENGEAKFFVPKNVYMRGTMNDIDKSIDSIDFAFRRRFKWVEKKFNKDKIKEIILEKGSNISEKTLDNYVKNCENLNNKLINDISIADESFKIGHAIFSNITKYIGEKNEITKNSKEELFENHIESILYNYLRMDYGNETTDIEKFKEVFIK